MKIWRWLKIGFSVGVILALPFLLVVGESTGQGLTGPVQWVGPITPTHCMEWVQAGYAEDSGGACGGIGVSGTPTSGQFAEWTNATTISGQTLGGDCTLSTATITCREQLGFAGASAAQNSTTYISTGGTVNSTSGAIVTASGTLKNLYIATVNTPAAGQSFTFAVQIAGVTSIITCQETTTASCNDLTDTASISAGNTFSIKVTTSATSGNTGAVSVGLELN